MNINFMKTFNENFGVKIFVKIAIFIFVISFSFIAFFIQHQRTILTDNLRKNGELLAGILAHNSRIAVFSENEMLLNNVVEGVFTQESVLEVSIFNQEGNLLKQQDRQLYKKSASFNRSNLTLIFDKLKETLSPFCLEDKRKIEFWSPVISGSDYYIEAPMFFEYSLPQRKQRIIGFVRITMSKKMLFAQLNNLLLKSILIGSLFLILGAGVAYFVSKGIIKPLNRLTEGVKTLGTGGAVDRLPVETDDEIGKLAEAFNTMSESLTIREEELRESEERLRCLSSQLLKIQEEERRRLSIELHDEMGQNLAFLKIRLRSTAKKLYEDQVTLLQDFEDVGRYIDEIIENVRRLSKELSPSILEDLGLSASLRWQVENFAKQHSLKISLNMLDIDHLFSQEVQINLYRIFQETLTNILKHAEANKISITVKEKNGYIAFLLEDDGKGFNTNDFMGRATPDKGMGITAMRERAYMTGGVLDIQSKPGKGTKITLEVPIQKEGDLS